MQNEKCPRGLKPGARINFSQSRLLHHLTQSLTLFIAVVKNANLKCQCGRKPAGLILPVPRESHKMKSLVLGNNLFRESKHEHEAVRFN